MRARAGPTGECGRAGVGDFPLPAPATSKRAVSALPARGKAVRGLGAWSAAVTAGRAAAVVAVERRAGRAWPVVGRGSRGERRRRRGRSRG